MDFPSLLWRLPNPIILASTSETRKSVLRSVGVPFDAVSPDVDERLIESALQAKMIKASEIALSLARAKASEVSKRFSGRWIIAADQTLECEGRQFHKPSSRDQAAEQLSKLSGKRHYLHSAVTCLIDSRIEFEHIETACLSMRRLSPSFINRYLDVCGETVTRSVGGYQIEGFGAHLFDEIEGDHTTILGLPILPVLRFFRHARLIEE
jgi:septum formation protein